MKNDTGSNMEKQVLPISVIIPTLNRPASLAATIKSYIAARHIPSEIIVVDQSVNEEDRLAIRKTVESCSSVTECGNVKGLYIRLDKPSTTVSRNIGAEAASNDIILYSDDDIEVQNDTVLQIYSLMSKPEYAMVQGNIMIPGNIMHRKKMKLSTLLFVCLSGKAVFWKLGKGHVSPGMFAWAPRIKDEDVETDWGMGASVSVRKSMAARWNIKWDEKMSGYAYSEDLDYTALYCHSARREKLRCVISHKARLYHLCSREYRIPTKQMAARIVINRLYLFYKHGGGFFGRLALEWCNFMLLLSMLIKGGAKNHWDAMKYCWSHADEIKKGMLKYE
ncbi:MAG: glycosyltransferase [Elusimicrobiales bacterium]|nr:glycosyltransferase [Elusimicrobiales bacterium]